MQRRGNLKSYLPESNPFSCFLAGRDRSRCTQHIGVPKVPLDGLERLRAPFMNEPVGVPSHAGQDTYLPGPLLQSTAGLLRFSQKPTSRQDQAKKKQDRESATIASSLSFDLGRYMRTSPRGLLKAERGRCWVRSSMTHPMQGSVTCDLLVGKDCRTSTKPLAKTVVGFPRISCRVWWRW
jgi:hypothetical protein